MPIIELMTQNGPGVGTHVALDRTVEVGTDSKVALVLDDASAAPRHARFTVDGDKVQVVDLGSAEGTFVNDARVDGTALVRVGDRVRIGMSVLQVRSGTPPLRVTETEASFVAPAFVLAQAHPGPSRFGPLASWTDSHVKQQTYVAALGLLCLSALAVLLIVFS